MFNSQRLTVARCRRGLSKTALAEAAGLSLRSISSYEADETDPEPASVEALAEVLRFPLAFFSGPELDQPEQDGVSFRSMKSITAAQRDSALAAGALAFALNDWLEARFNLPPPNVPELDLVRKVDPEAAAGSVRAAWGLGEKPIRNVVHLLEAHGVRIFSLVEEARQLDAFSTWRHGRPFVFLNTIKSAERSRFDAAHELGHLVLHRRGTSGRPTEQEADAFASAFLMPRSTVIAHAPRLPRVDDLVSLKKHWQVSVSALAHRLKSLGLVSEWHYRMLCIEIQQLGYRKKEPQSITRESSQVFRKVFASLSSEGITKAHVASALSLAQADLDALVFGLALVGIDGSAATGRPRKAGRAKLRLV